MPADLARARAGRHVASLDGVRGLAILLVLVYHGVLYGGMQPALGPDRWVLQLASIGWAGVDLFFVLSGFLITGILLDSRRSPTYFRSFYARRVLRIFPLYFVFLAVYLWLFPSLHDMGAGFDRLWSEQAWYWTYLVNLRVAIEGWPEYSALGHFWSLAVEEQFYLVWPLVVYACRRETLVRICLACVVLPMFVRVALVLSDQAIAAQVLTFARLDTLAIGALLAIQVRRPTGFALSARLARGVLYASLLILAAMFLRLGSFWSEIPLVATLGFSVVALAGGSLIAALLASTGPRRMPRFFESPILRFLGKYSYGIYVLHHPLMIYLGQSRFAASEWPRVLGSQLPGQAGVLLIGMLLSIVAALLSWYLLEAPILRMKRRFPYESGRSRADLGEPAFDPTRSATLGG